MSHDAINEEPFWRIGEWFKDFSHEKLNLLKAYHLDLCKWTKKINLISAGTILEADRVHFADSILGCAIFSNKIKNEVLKDLGSGNGFPGIVFAILNPEVQVECIDSDERKIVFIKQFSLRQGLKNLKVRRARIEDVGADSIHYAMTRGLGEIKTILELTKDKIVSKGSIYMFKGAEWKEELGRLPERFKESFVISLVGEYRLPEGLFGANEPRVILEALRL